MSSVADLLRELRCAEDVPPPGQYRTAEPHFSDGQKVAIGTSGSLHVLLPMPLSAAIIEDHKSAGVQLLRHELIDEGGNKRLFADLACFRGDLEVTFCRLADEVLAEAEATGVRADAVARAALARWRDLLDAERQQRMSASELTGLFGELLTLKAAVDCGRGIEVWTGREPGRHDFRFGTDALEVKTSIATQRDIIHVNGMKQLEPPAAGALYLRRLRVELSPSGTSVPTLVEDICKAGAPRSELMSCLLRRGYSAAFEPAYEETKFEVREDDVWKVEGDFPRLRTNSFVNGAPPPGVHIRSYEIDLASAANFKLSESAHELLIAGWANEA